MNRRLGLLALGAFAVLVIAIFLRDTVEQLIIRPAAYLLWWLGIYYRFIPQPILWFGLVLLLLYLSFGNLAGQIKWFRRRIPLFRHREGPLEEFAHQIERRQGGVFFKWQVARHLGDLALDLQELRQHVRRRPLTFGPGASPAVRQFLDSALKTSFSDYPNPAGLPLPGQWRSLPPTPFDLDLEPVIAYLESQLENDDDFKRP